MAIAFRGQFYFAAEGHSYFAREGQRRLPSGVKRARLFQGVPVYYFAGQADLLDEAYRNVKASRKIAVPDISLVTLEERNLAKAEPDEWTRYPQYNPNAPKPGWYWSDFFCTHNAYICINYAGERDF